MANLGKLALSFLALPALLLAASSAAAYTTPETCGKFFNFDANSVDCKVRVKAECSLDCSSVKFVAACDGGCVAKPTPGCKDDCGPPCVAECDPSKLDCIQGCHDECEQPFIKDCQAAHPERDCVNDATASCTGHCRNLCKVQPSNCIEHCDSCCAGACTSLSNLECDIDCYAGFEGSCKAQCDAPEGALFCNGQYVGATDVKTCINDLIAQGLSVDVKASGQVECDLNGCDALGNASAGGIACAARVPGEDSPFAMTALALGALGAGISAIRRRTRKS